MLKQFIKEKANQTEIMRFIIVGIICTIADYLTSLLFQYVVYPDHALTIFVASLAGFIVGVIINYVLSITKVFKNVKNEKTARSIGGFVLFVSLSAIGYVINLGIKEAGNLIIPFANNVLWFTFVFGCATLIVLIYNYISRKLILFKPRGNSEDNDTAI